MRDEGLDQAIRSVGGVSELARRLGIAQPSVSNWARIPAERVAAVESATGIARDILRPDLFGKSFPVTGAEDDVDAARAQEYALLSVLLARAPDAAFLQRLSTLRADPSPLGLVHAGVGQAASIARPEDVDREYFDLFVGIGRGELLPYASYYLTGFLHERPLARLLDDLNAFGIERVEGNPEPEDHAAILFEIMAGIVGRRFDTPEDADKELFEKHLKPWIGRFFADLEQAEAARFYRSVGTLGRTFIEIETEAFALPS